MLLAAYILLGFPFGTFQTMTVAYASELMPVALRPILTTYVNLCWVIGQIIASGVNLAFIGDDSEWAYKSKCICVRDCDRANFFSSLRHPVGMAGPNHARYLLCSRITLVPRP